MKRTVFASFALAAIATASAQSLEQSLVGNWRVDIKSIAYAPSEKAKAEIAKQPKGAVDGLIKMVGGSVSPLTFSFKADHTFSVSGAKGPDGKEKVEKGTWTLKGQNIKVTMKTAQAQKQPEFTIAKNGKRLSAKQSDPNFGTISMGFVKK